MRLHKNYFRRLIVPLHTFVILAVIKQCLSVTRLVPLEKANFVGPHEKYHARADYMAWLELSRSYPETLSLDHYISILNQEKCLVVLDNFANINLPQTSRPVIIRHPKLFVIEKEISTERYYLYHVIWSSTLSQFYNQTIKSNFQLKCSLSKFLTGTAKSQLIWRIKDTCLRLNFDSFLAHVKPWTCQLQFIVLPPSFLSPLVMEGNRYPKIFAYGHAEDYHLSSVSTTHVIFLFSPYEPIRPRLATKMFKLLQETVRGAGKMNTGAVQNPFFFCLELIEDVSTTPNLKVSWQAGSLNLLSTCLDCSTGGTGAYYYFDLKMVSNLPNNLSEIKSMSYPLHGESIDWSVDTGQVETGFPFKEMIALLMECDENTLLTSFNNRQEKIASFFAGMWRSIMKNYTIFGRAVINCNSKEPATFAKIDTFPVILRQNSFIRDHVYTRYPISDLGKRLRFVSCGRRHLSSLPFLKLVSVFDWPIWVCVIVTTIVVPIPLCTLGHSRNFSITYRSKHFLSVIKVLLEQGNPFCVADKKSNKLKLIMSIFLLMGVVVSNAYKNSNVYTMVIPRFPVSMKTFHDLVTHNFSVYTKVAYIYSLIPLPPAPKDCDRVRIKTDLISWDVCVESEVSQVVTNTKKAIFPKDRYGKVKPSNTMSKDVFKNVKVLSSGVYNRSRFHPSVASIVKRDGIDGRHQIFAEDLTNLFTSLKSCENVAVVLQQHLCQKYARNLRLENNSSNVVSIGQEKYSDVQWMFRLDGRVPPFIIKRYESIGTSGILQWLMELSSGGGVTTDVSSEVLPPEAASLKGNVVIIFAVWVFGKIFAILVFIVEASVTNKFL